MALLERLQILIDADTKGAAREFEQIGQKADKELGRAEDRIGKVSARLQSIGTAAALGGAAVVGGLGLLAKASDDANRQVLKLENSIKNSDQAFRKNGAALQDLAGDLQKVTAADADATVGAQALLVQFGLTESQILQLTPLVVDLSRKMGIDMDAAAKAVGRSVDGSATALKRMGISVDETAFATDSFKATFDALSQTVGGFARVEGKTFSGQLEILKNNLGDLGEQVGTGAAGVLGSLAGQAASAAGALNQLNPGILTAAGGLATTGGLVATVGGGFAVAAGKALEFRDSLTRVGDDGARSMTKIGKAAAGIAAVGAVVGIVTTFAEVANQVTKIDSRLSTATDKFRSSLTGTNAELANTFLGLAEVEDQTFKLSNIWEGFGASVDIGGVAADIEDAQRAFSSTLDSFGPDAAQNVLDGLRDINEGLDKNSDQYKINARFIEDNQAKVDDRRKAIVEATIADKESTRQQERAIKAEEKRQVTIDAITTAVGEYEKALGNLSKEFDDNARKAGNFATALEKTTNVDGAVSAAIGAAEGFTSLKESIGALPDELDVAGIALGNYGQAALDALSDLESYGEQAGGFLEQMIQSGMDDAAVTAMADQFRKQLTEALLAAGIPPEKIPEYLGLAGLDEQQIKVALELANEQEFLENLKLRLQLYQKELEGAPLEVRAKILDRIESGDVAGANALIDAYNAIMTGNPVMIRAAFESDPEAMGRVLGDLQFALSEGTLDIPADIAPPPPYATLEDYVAAVIAAIVAGKPFIPVDMPVDDEGAQGEVDGFIATNDGRKINIDVITRFVNDGLGAFPIFGGGGAGSGSYWDNRRENERQRQRPPFGNLPPGFGGGRATGGPVMAGKQFNVNEVGAEMFVPSTPGFVMDHSESKALIEGVRQIIAGGAGGVVVNQQITTADPVQAGSESARRMRDASYLVGV